MTVAAIVQALHIAMGGAPGRCANCGADAYIQLAATDTMLCAHCYARRIGTTRIAGRKGGERKPTLQPRSRLA